MRFDTDRVIQVLNNLISNALKFTEQGGITVTSLLDKDSSSVTVRVRDTGEGIRSEDLPKLFQKFEQLGGLNQRKTGGTGLGLAISKEIILQHGGSIFAESEYGKGTVVTFILPLQQRQTILIIDDERMLLDICEMNLKAGGYNVLLSESGVDGLELAQKKSPDLVILDMKLADLSGYELIGRLRSNKATAAIPILVMSGYAEEIAKIEYNQQELALPWISKPFRNEDFLALIKSLLIK
jgi:Signal transduction histidine kinase